MNKDEILNAICTLSSAQGFYSDLYDKLTDGSIESENFLQELVDADFKDTVDLVLYLES